MGDEMTTQHEARRLTRRHGGKVFAGVAAGLADYYQTDPLWIRLMFVLAAFLGGAGVIAYIILMIVMPKDSSAPPTDLERQAERVAASLRGTPAWIGVALIIVGGLLIVTQFADWDGSVFTGLALIALGIVLFRKPEERVVEPIPAPDVPPPVPAPGELPPAIPSDTAPAVPSPPPVRRERSRLGWLTLGAMMLALGVASLLDRSDVVHIKLVQYLALALAVLGIGILAGAWLGRARWLVVPAILLVPFVLVASLIHVPFTGGTGDLLFHPTSVAAVDREYHLAAGQMVIDLSAIPPGPQPLTVRATDVAGQIIVYVPAAATVDIRARVGAGEVQLLSRRHDGVNVDVRRTLGPAAKPGIASWFLDLETSLGRVEVRTGPSPEAYS